MHPASAAPCWLLTECALPHVTRIDAFGASTVCTTWRRGGSLPSRHIATPRSTNSFTQRMAPSSRCSVRRDGLVMLVGAHTQCRPTGAGSGPRRPFSSSSCICVRETTVSAASVSLHSVQPCTGRAASHVQAPASQLHGFRHSECPLPSRFRPLRLVCLCCELCFQLLLLLRLHQLRMRHGLVSILARCSIWEWGRRLPSGASGGQQPCPTCRPSSLHGLLASLCLAGPSPAASPPRG